MKNFLIKIICVFFVLVLLIAGGCFYYVNSFLSTPASTDAHEIEIQIAPNMTFAEVSKRLEAIGAVTNARNFTLLAEWKQLTGKLRTGRFLVNTGWKPDEVLEHLVSGNPVLDRITLPEGLTWWETAKRLEEAGFVRYEDFEKVIHDPDFLRHYGIPLASAEGYLFPDTYYIMRPLELDEASARKVAGRLVDNFWRRITVLYEAGKTFTPEDRRQVANNVILASIVEKETAVAGERARVAGVYFNRLSRDMILQADPTTIYGIGPSFEGRLRRSDLQNADNMYNTYRHKGLPPGPICSPGLAAIKAAMEPEAHHYIFFVAKGDGSHQFSRTLDEHNRAVKMFILDK